VEGREIKQRVTKIVILSNGGKVGIHDRIPSFHDVFRPLLAGDSNYNFLDN
jgi:hypothetical protein